MKNLLSTVFLLTNYLCFGGSVIDPSVMGDWSETVNGLRGRLVSSENVGSNGKGKAVIYLELQNVSDVLNPMEIYIDTSHSPLHFELKDASGMSPTLPKGNYATDEWIPNSFWLHLPMDSTLRFRVSRKGPFSYPNVGLAIAVPGNFWIIPNDASKNYFLSASFSINPSFDKDHFHAWKGYFKIPQVKIFTAKTLEELRGSSLGKLGNRPD